MVFGRLTFSISMKLLYKISIICLYIKVIFAFAQVPFSNIRVRSPKIFFVFNFTGLNRAFCCALFYPSCNLFFIFCNSTLAAKLGLFQLRGIGLEVID